MDSALNKVISLILYTLMGISVIISGLFYFDFISENLFIIWAYILIGIATLTALGFAVSGIFTSSKSAKNSLIPFAVAVVLIFVAYLIASDEVLVFQGYEKFFYEDNSMDPNVFSKLIGTGLMTTYSLGILALISIFYTEISKMTK